MTLTPNLTLSSVQGPSDTFSSSQVQVSWVETNNGIGPTRTSFWYDGIYLSASTNFNDPVYFASLGAVPNAAFLNPGDSYSNSINVTIPRGLDGLFYVLVRADDANYVFETNKADNVRASGQFLIELTPTPDLQVTTVLPPHNGLFRWRLSRAFAETATPINIIVTDNGVPPLSTNRIFTVNVQDFLNIALGTTNIQSGQSCSVPVNLTSSDGVTNLSFTVQISHNILTNLSVTAIAPQLASATLQDNTSNIVLTFVTLPG